MDVDGMCCLCVDADVIALQESLSKKMSSMRYIFMRWKEDFFLDMNGQCGLTIAGKGKERDIARVEKEESVREWNTSVPIPHRDLIEPHPIPSYFIGFYYVCLDRMNGSIEGAPLSLSNDLSKDISLCRCLSYGVGYVVSRRVLF